MLLMIYSLPAGETERVAVYRNEAGDFVVQSCSGHVVGRRLRYILQAQPDERATDSSASQGVYWQSRCTKALRPPKPCVIAYSLQLLWHKLFVEKAAEGVE